MKKLISLFIICVMGCSSCAVALNEEVSSNDIKYPSLNYSEYPIDLAYVFKSTYKLGPNFDDVNYIFTFSCGGGAICIGAYSNGENDFLVFPDVILGDGSPEFSISYSKKSDILCLSGQSAYDSEIVYENSCFKFENYEFNMIKK